MDEEILEVGERNRPVQSSRRGAVGNSVAIIAFTEVPEANLVEIVEADGAGDGVYEDGVGDGGGDYVGEVDGEEVGRPDDGLRESESARKGSR
jgi:hypothetical protein